MKSLKILFFNFLIYLVFFLVIGFFPPFIRFVSLIPLSFVLYKVDFRILSKEKKSDD